jgi:hypothetical protein
MKIESNYLNKKLKQLSTNPKLASNCWVVVAIERLDSCREGLQQNTPFFLISLNFILDYIKFKFNQKIFSL